MGIMETIPIEHSCLLVPGRYEASKPEQHTHTHTHTPPCRSSIGASNWRAPDGCMNSCIQSHRHPNEEEDHAALLYAAASSLYPLVD